MRPLILKVVLIISSLYFLFSVSGSVVSLPDRVSLIHNSLGLIQKYPILGVGLGNFIPASGLYQPVHNIYLLLASELGLPAAIFIGVYLLKFLKSLLNIKHWTLNIAIASVLAIGMVDHYWLTLHQNILLLVILMAYAHLHRWGSQR